MSHSLKRSQVSKLETRSEAKSSASNASSTRRSHKSNGSQAAAEARAKAEAARTKAEFAKRQIDMEVEKARIEATLNALKEEGEAEAALAAARVLESAAICSNDGTERGNSVAAERTNEFIRTHFSQNQSVKEDDDQASPKHKDVPGNSQFTPDAANATSRHDQKEYQHLRQPTCFSSHVKETHSPSKPVPRSSEVSDLAVFLARRDLLSSSFKIFDNKPESYRPWKTAFLNAIDGLNLKANEELDLLTKWLEGESLRHALRIRAAHAYDPEAGLRQLWQRLEKKYGSPEVIEASLFKRLESFTKISHKDLNQLQELADLLLEVQAVKEEGSLPGLGFLDTSKGINSIVEKLPHSLQEAWIVKGTKFKKECLLHYPPFSYFVEFVNEHADMRTDPSFSFQSSNALPLRDERIPMKQSRFRHSISVNKTEVESNTSVRVNTGLVDLTRHCPLHKRNHSLLKCRGFRMKSLADRKRFLKENSICYKCCVSSAHMAKDCRMTIHCSECNSQDHVSALHDGPAPWFEKTPTAPMEAQGGERKEPTSTVTTSVCTEICGIGLKGKSCSKICLVNVYPTCRSLNAVNK